MLNAIPMVISKESFEQIFTFAEDNSALAKNLYNASLFRIRQVFTGWNKTKRTDLEQLVFDELKQTEAVYKSFKPRHVLSYAALDKIMRATGNPDFFAGLPMQTAQQVLKDAVHDFKAWLDSLKKYKKAPANLTDLQHNQIMRLYARALKAKRRPKYSLGIICQWIGGLVNSPLFARSAYGSFALCSKDESGTASRTKPFTGNSWRCFSELRSVLDTTSIGAMHRIGVETSF